MHIYNIKQQKHTNKQTDLLEDILKCISNNPMAYANVHTHSSNNNMLKSENQQQTKNVQQGRGQDHKQKTINTPDDTDTRQQSSKAVKTRYGRTVKKPDRLTYS